MPDNIGQIYVEAFNEADAGRRTELVKQLWSADARVCTASSEYVGVAEVVERVRLAYEEFVQGGGYHFRALGDHRHHDAVLVRWEMRPAGGGDAAAAGLQFLLLDGAGLIQQDFQFVDG